MTTFCLAILERSVVGGGVQRTMGRGQGSFGDTRRYILSTRVRGVLADYSQRLAKTRAGPASFLRSSVAAVQGWACAARLQPALTLSMLSISLPARLGMHPVVMVPDVHGNQSRRKCHFMPDMTLFLAGSVFCSGSFGMLRHRFRWNPDCPPASPLFPTNQAVLREQVSSLADVNKPLSLRSPGSRLRGAHNPRCAPSPPSHEAFVISPWPSVKTPSPDIGVGNRTRVYDPH